MSVQVKQLILKGINAFAFVSTRIFSVLLIFCSFLLSASPAFSSAWVQPKKQALLISELAWSTANHLTDQQGHSRNIQFSKKYIKAYAEAGLNRNWTLVGQTSVESSDYRDTPFHQRQIGFSQSSLGLRRQLWKHKDWSASTELHVLIGGQYSGAEGFAYQLGGNGAQLGAGLGRYLSRSGGEGYGQLTARYQFFEAQGDRARISLDGGLHWRRNIWYIAALRHEWAQNGKEVQHRAWEVTSLETSLLLDLGRFKIQTGSRFNLRSRNSVHEAAVFTKLWLPLNFGREG